MGQRVSNSTELRSEDAVILTPQPESLKHLGNNLPAEATQKQRGWVFMAGIVIHGLGIRMILSTLPDSPLWSAFIPWPKKHSEWVVFLKRNSDCWQPSWVH